MGLNGQLQKCADSAFAGVRQGHAALPPLSHISLCMATSERVNGVGGRHLGTRVGHVAVRQTDKREWGKQENAAK